MELTSPLITAPHGFFTKQEQGGGDLEHVRKTLGALKLITAKQIHSNIAKYVDETFEGSPECDAFVTDKPGIAIGVYTADCVPILFHDAEAKIIGVAHAGWKGARYGIIESTINLMKSRGAQNIYAAIGPCIHQKSYEVDSAFRENFMLEGRGNHVFFITGKMAGKFQFNLPGYVSHKLKQSGLNEKNIGILNEDTLTQPQKFCSFRRGTLAGIKENGRQISAICLK